MRQMCEESKDVGMKTMSALENQGESIDRWEEVVDGINQVIIIFISGASLFFSKKGLFGSLNPHGNYRFY